jgi:hypothetical protein
MCRSPTPPGPIGGIRRSRTAVGQPILGGVAREARMHEITRPSVRLRSRADRSVSTRGAEGSDTDFVAYRAAPVQDSCAYRPRPPPSRRLRTPFTLLVAVPGVGFEPTRPRGQRGLSLLETVRLVRSRPSSAPWSGRFVRAVRPVRCSALPCRPVLCRNPCSRRAAVARGFLGDQGVDERGELRHRGDDDARDVPDHHPARTVREPDDGVRRARLGA